MDSGQWAVDTETMGADNYQSVGTGDHWTLGHAATAHWTSCHHAWVQRAASGQPHLTAYNSNADWVHLSLLSFTTS